MKQITHFISMARESVLLRDARNFQIIFLSSFLLFGIWNLGWDLEIERYAIIFSVCLLTQTAGILLTGAPVHSLKSALITSLGLTLLFKADSMTTIALGAFMAIGSKFLIRFNGKHLYNPANFGIIMSILLLGDAWISPGQWGSSAILLFFIGSAGFMIIFRVGRVDTSLAFIGTLFILEYARSILYLGWPHDFLFHKFMNGSLLLYTFFMITDPVTTPNHKVSRWIWASGVAVVTFILGNWYQVHTAPVWALFFVTPLTVIFDRLLVAKKFQWIKA
jgi:Na+-transporting NADH:ubiquinone oxidoreductase subunit NqrB